MLVNEINNEQAIYIVIDKTGFSSYLPKEDLSKWLSDGSITLDDTVLAVTVHNVLFPKNKIQLTPKESNQND